MRRGEVRARPLGLPRADRPLVQHDHRLALLRQQIRGHQPGDARADDADVGVGLLRRGRELWRWRRVASRSEPCGRRAISCGQFLRGRRAGVSASKILIEPDGA